jgi:D-beta-D-heptose 7-phosphate kinase / D-beta-D-heptose 1-phosphate adenosyltransferase
MQLLNQFLKKQRSQKLNIHCVGDAMIDEYYSVSVNRISPEFPMPIMHSEKDNAIRKPGGVANVVYQFRHLNVNARLICFSDTEATVIFREHNLNFTPCIMGSSIIPRKKRFLDNGIQVKRWDIEQANCGLSDPIKQRKDALEFTKNFEQPDVVILSDYDKGFFEGINVDPSKDWTSNQQWLERYKDCITIVDPKHGPVLKWNGCTVFKPNAKEAKELSGLIDPKEQCKFFIDTIGCQSVIITQGGKGFVSMTGNEYFEYNSESCCSLPESVIGAGDCFSAFLAQALGLGFSAKESAIIAFEAGAIYVTNRMNRPIVPAELIKDKLVEPEDLLHRDFKLVFTNGCFDLLHRGHLQTLRFAKSKGEKLVVALNTDSSIKRLKGESRPIKTLAEREAVMAALDMVDFVVSFDEDTPYEIIQKCKPDILVKGGDYQHSKISEKYGSIVKEIYISPSIEGLSTSNFLK